MRKSLVQIRPVAVAGICAGTIGSSRGRGGGHHRRNSWSPRDASGTSGGPDSSAAGSAETIQRANVLVVVRHGCALPSVVAGVWPKPVIAPTAIGAGASFGGLAALLRAMLNSLEVDGVTGEIEMSVDGMRRADIP